MTAKRELTAAERFHQQKEKQTVEIVDLEAPSGFVYKFEKPSKFKMLFGFGELPQMAASGAVKQWTEDGILQGIEEGDADALKLAKATFDLRDRVLALSVSPKLVMGTADASKDELSTDDVPDDDLEFFMRWISTGGESSAMLGNFPSGSQQGPVAGVNRKARRATAKRTRGNKG